MLGLAPLSGLFALLANARRWRQQAQARSLGVPLVVVGNISVGGTGKTPLIIALVRVLQASGFRPGVISRGYGAPLNDSRLLDDRASAGEFGDEPVLIQQATGCLVAVGPQRQRSVRLLLEQRVDVVLSDDGLQHYALFRDKEIAIVDGQRGLGNGWRLPVGPLREAPRRLRECDWVLVNGRLSNPLHLPAPVVPMQLVPVTWCNVRTGKRCGLHQLKLDDPVAIAGIGNPQRFFQTLESLGLDAQKHAFGDHHRFTAGDLAFVASRPLLMTEKDAVKCRPFAKLNWWALEVEARLPDSFIQEFCSAIHQLTQ